MKLRTFTLLLITTFFIHHASAQNAVPTAETVLNAALKKASVEKKKVLVVFHASWCGWCRKMEASLNDPSVKPFFDKNYVIADLVVYESKGKENLENPGAVDLLKKYNNADQGLPTWLIFDAQQNLLADSQMRPEGAKLGTKGENTGCPSAEKEVQHFLQSLKKSSNPTQADLDKIEARFRKNAA
ncbi:thioredoxin family protein [Pedobacter metabolipauper]|nr:thioredoxin family protein [Pedobacter metabolipauper]